MFERYSEVARRSIFFARYEAAQMGSRYIETHHLLLGLMREEKDFFRRFLDSPTVFDELRRQFEAAFPVRERASSSVDLPLSAASKRALEFAAAEADALRHRTIAPVHLVLGLLKIDTDPAAQALRERGMTVERVRADAATFADKDVRIIARHFVGAASDPIFDLHRLISELPDDRLRAAAQVLEALGKPTVDLTVRTPEGKFTISFEPPGAAASGKTT